MIDAIHDALRRADSDVRVIVLTSALGGILCGGMDLRMIDAGDALDLLAFVDKCYMRANDLDYRRNVENQIEALCNVFATANGREGVRAFIEKRSPRWDRG